MLFKDYLEADMYVEATRAFKLTAMSYVQKHMLPEDREIMAGGEKAEV